MPPLTEEERKRHSYVVVSAEQGMPYGNGDEVTFDENGEPATIQYRTAGYAVISADLSGDVTMTTQTWHVTKEDAQAWADNMCQHDLERKRRDDSMNSERQKAVLAVLDAALLSIELEMA